MSTTVDTATEIRSFQIDAPQEKLEDLRRRIQATRWPSKELVPDRSQGVQLATVQELVRLGNGVSLIPAMAARQDRHPDRRYVRLGDAPPTRTVGVAWCRSRHLTKVTRRFVEAVRREGRARGVEAGPVAGL